MKIQSVVRAVRIISLFTSHLPELGISDIASKLGLNKATTWGLVNTLVETGLLDQNKNSRKYHLGSLCYDLGMVFASTLEINRVAMEPIHRLANRMKLTARLGVWDRNSVLVTLVARPQGQEQMAPQVGPRVFPHCTAIGKAALAFLERDDLEIYFASAKLVRFTPNTITEREQLVKELDEIRKRGYSIGREELRLGQAGISAPVFGKLGRLAGVIGIHGNVQGILGDDCQLLSVEVCATAAEISSRMGYYPMFRE